MDWLKAQPTLPVVKAPIVPTPVVQIYINNVLRYSVSANVYRSDTKSNNGFVVSINRKFLTLRSNLVEIRIIDSSHQLASIAYKGYVNR